jgi:hypothetical protein
LALVASEYDSGDTTTTTAPGARTEAFSDDDLKFAVPKI